MYVDAHCHLAEFGIAEIKSFLSDILIVAVADDVTSSQFVIDMAKYEQNVIPCVGIHPWEVYKSELKEVDRIQRLLDENDIKCLGEIGLDKKFTPDTWLYQIKLFERFLALAKEYDLILNLHAAGAWGEVYEMIVKYDIDKAIFHWYTGPLDLIDNIVGNSYYISINPAVRIQEKHKRVVENTDINHILTESDGPYKYRGMLLSPSLIPELVKIIANIKGLSVVQTREILWRNFRRIFT